MQPVDDHPELSIKGNLRQYRLQSYRKKSMWDKIDNALW